MTDVVNHSFVVGEKVKASDCNTLRFGTVIDIKPTRLGNTKYRVEWVSGYGNAVSALWFREKNVYAT